MQPNPILTPCHWKHSKPSLQSITVARAGRRFIHSTGDLMSNLHRGNKGLSYSNAWWESGSSSQRHKRRKCPQNHITLSSPPPLFSIFSISNSLPLVSTPCFHLCFLTLLYEFPCFSPLALIFFNISIKCSPSSLFIPGHLLLHLFLEKMCNCTAAVGVCFHIDAKEKCRFCSKVTELSRWNPILL